MRAIAIALVLAFSVGARAQVGETPPTVPQLPDEPLPEWHVPPKRAGAALFLELTPQMQEAQKLRQAGLWISSLGWLQIFAGGILYVWAASVNTDLGHPTPNSNGIFDPTLEDKRNKISDAASAFLGIGATMAAGGFVLYTIGQWKMTSHHKKHPNEPLPPLSGF
ncbi:MAG: hypothetical protein JWM53_2930 [bacterium]|nr:hypothetical protein [bacterium]